MDAKEFIPRSFGTHDGAFHADEVSACALLLLYGFIDRTAIYRSRNSEILAKCEYVCDVGGLYDIEKKQFDHHQADYTGGLSSAGMILKYLYEKNTIDKDEYSFFNNSLMIGVDAFDTGRETPKIGFASFSEIVENFTPIEYGASNEEMDAAFYRALDFVLGHLERIRKRFFYHKSCQKVVAEIMEKYDDCLIFEESIAWQESFFALDGENHPAKFVVMPTGRHWKLRAVPPSLEKRMSVRVPLPEEWAGLLEGELKKKTGIEGAIFCHKGRFISVWETKEDALEALQIVKKLTKNLTTHSL